MAKKWLTGACRNLSSADFFHLLDSLLFACGVPRGHPLIRLTENARTAVEAVLEDPEEEDRNTENIAAPETSRLLNQAVGPFQTHHAYRLRCTWHSARDEIEKRTNRQNETCVIGADILVNPFFLQRRAH